MKYIINIKHIIIIFDRMPFFVTLFIYYLLKKMKVKKNIKYLNPFQFLYDKESSHSFCIWQGFISSNYLFLYRPLISKKSFCIMNF
jgi:hypothetical protein